MSTNKQQPHAIMHDNDDGSDPLIPYSQIFQIQLRE